MNHETIKQFTLTEVFIKSSEALRITTWKDEPILEACQRESGLWVLIAY